MPSPEARQTHIKPLALLRDERDLADPSFPQPDAPEPVGGHKLLERPAPDLVGDGRGVGAHGSVEMPVWGSVFKAAAGSESAARSRIEAIVAYLRSLQERPGDDR